MVSRSRVASSSPRAAPTTAPVTVRLAGACSRCQAVGVAWEATSSVPVRTWKCVTAPWVSTTIVVPRTAATAFGVRTSTVSPGRRRGRATLNAMPPAFRSIPAWVASSVMRRTDSSRTVSSALRSSNMRTKERSAVRIVSAPKMPSLNRSGAGVSPAMLAVRVACPDRVVTTPIGSWAEQSPGKPRIARPAASRKRLGIFMSPY